MASNTANAQKMYAMDGLMSVFLNRIKANTRIAAGHHNFLFWKDLVLAAHSAPNVVR